MSGYVKDYQEKAAQALITDSAYAKKREAWLWGHLKDENGNTMTLEETNKLMKSLTDKPLHEVGRPVARDNMAMFYAMSKGMTPDEVVKAVDQEDPKILVYVQEYLDIVKRQDPQEIIGVLDNMQKTMLSLPKEEYLQLNNPDYVMENYTKVKLLAQYSINIRQNFYSNGSNLEDQWSKQIGVKNYLDNRAITSNLSMMAHMGMDMVDTLSEIDATPRSDGKRVVLAGFRNILDQTVSELSSMDGYSDFLHSERLLEVRAAVVRQNTSFPSLQDRHRDALVNYAIGKSPNEIITVLPNRVSLHPKDQQKMWDQHNQNDIGAFYKTASPDRVTLTIHDQNIHPNDFLRQVKEHPSSLTSDTSKESIALKTIYEETFSKVKDSPLMTTAEMKGFSEFDMIYIDGRSATELFGGKTPGLTPEKDVERIKKQVALAALQGDKHIDICRPEIDQDGTFRLSKPIAADIKINAPERRPTVKERFKHFFRIERIPESRAKAAEKLSAQDQKGDGCEKRMAEVADRVTNAMSARPFFIAQSQAVRTLQSIESGMFSMVKDPENPGRSLKSSAVEATLQEASTHFWGNEMTRASSRSQLLNAFMLSKGVPLDDLMTSNRTTDKNKYTQEYYNMIKKGDPEEIAECSAKMMEAYLNLPAPSPEKLQSPDGLIKNHLEFRTLQSMGIALNQAIFRNSGETGQIQARLREKYGNDYMDDMNNKLEHSMFFAKAAVECVDMAAQIPPQGDKSLSDQIADTMVSHITLQALSQDIPYKEGMTMGEFNSGHNPVAVFFSTKGAVSDYAKNMSPADEAKNFDYLLKGTPPAFQFKLDKNSMCTVSNASEKQREAVTAKDLVKEASTPQKKTSTPTKSEATKQSERESKDNGGRGR